jgi:hypothetical protein
MASGVSTPNITDADALDEVIGNVVIGGIKRTRRTTITKLATQLLAGGPLGEEIEAILAALDALAGIGERQITRADLDNDLKLTVPLIGLDRAPDYTPLVSLQTFYSGIIANGGDGKHRHFGDLITAPNGTKHFFLRLAVSHGTIDKGAVIYFRKKLGMAWEAEKVVLPQLDTEEDQRAIIAGVTHSGRVVVAYSQSPTIPTIVSANSMGPAYLKSFHFDDDGDALMAGTLPVSNPFLTVSYSWCQPFGTIKFEIINGQTEGYFSFFCQRAPSGETNAFRVGTIKVTGNGTVLAQDTPIYNSVSPVYSETAMQAITPDVCFAVARANSAGLQLFRRAVRGGGWTPLGTIPGTTDQDVAPSLNLMYKNGRPHLVLFSVDRAANVMKVRIAAVDDVYNSADLFRNTVTTSTGMGAASGYQHTILYPNGEMEWVQFKENGDPNSTDIQFCHGRPIDWLESGWSFNPRIYGSTSGTAVADNGATTGWVAETGDLIDFWFSVNMAAKGSTTGQFQIELPFPVKNASGARGGVSIGYHSGITLTITQSGTTPFAVSALQTGIGGLCLQNTSRLGFYIITTSGSNPTLNIDNANVSATAAITGHARYIRQR